MQFRTNPELEELLDFSLEELLENPPLFFQELEENNRGIEAHIFARLTNENAKILPGIFGRYPTFSPRVPTKVVKDFSSALGRGEVLVGYWLETRFTPRLYLFYPSSEWVVMVQPRLCKTTKFMNMLPYINSFQMASQETEREVDIINLMKLLLIDKINFYFKVRSNLSEENLASINSIINSIKRKEFSYILQQVGYIPALRTSFRFLFPKISSFVFNDYQAEYLLHLSSKNAYKNLSVVAKLESFYNYLLARGSAWILPIGRSLDENLAKWIFKRKLKVNDKVKGKVGSEVNVKKIFKQAILQEEVMVGLLFKEEHPLTTLLLFPDEKFYFEIIPSTKDKNYLWCAFHPPYSNFLSKMQEELIKRNYPQVSCSAVENFVRLCEFFNSESSSPGF